MYRIRKTAHASFTHSGTPPRRPREPLARLRPIVSTAGAPRSMSGSGQGTMIERFDGDRLTRPSGIRARQCRRCASGAAEAWSYWPCLAPLGCAEQHATVKPAETLALLQAGRPLLTCREPCLAEWRRAQPQAAQLDAGKRWQDLALLLARIGYQDDLSLYYLGRAAEGLGYRPAAAAYYRQSTEISRHPVACQS